MDCLNSDNGEKSTLLSREFHIVTTQWNFCKLHSHSVGVVWLVSVPSCHSYSSKYEEFFTVQTYRAKTTYGSILDPDAICVAASYVYQNVSMGHQCYVLQTM